MGKKIQELDDRTVEENLFLAFESYFFVQHQKVKIFVGHAERCFMIPTSISVSSINRSLFFENVLFIIVSDFICYCVLSTN